MVSENSHEHSAKNGVLFNKEQTELVFYPMGKKEGAYLMPEGVREIASQAFYGCEHLKHVVFADSMEKIAPDAFVNCPNLDEATRKLWNPSAARSRQKKRNGNGMCAVL